MYSNLSIRHMYFEILMYVSADWLLDRAYSDSLRFPPNLEGGGALSFKLQ